MSTLVAHTFDADTVGALAASWTQDTAGVWTAQTAPAGMSGRAHRAAQNASTDDFAIRSFTRQTSANGDITIGWKQRIGTPITAGHRWGYLYFYDGATLGGGVFTFDGSFYVLRAGGSTVLQAFSASTAYTVQAVLNFSTGKIKSVTIDGTTYNNAGAGWTIDGSLTGFDRIKTGRFSPSVDAGQFIWFDDLAILNAGDAYVAPPGAPTIGTGAVDKWGQVSLPVTAGTGTTSTLKVYKSTSSGGALTDITSGCTLINNGSGSWTVKEIRPHYGTAALAYGGTGYYKVAGVSTFEGAQSSEASVASVTPDKTAVETPFFAVLSTIMAGSHVVSSSAGETYPGYWLMGMAYAYQQTSTAQYKTDALNQLAYLSGTLTDANGLISLPDFAGHVYRDFHGRTLLHAATAGRLLAYAGAGSDAQTVIDQCDVWAKAMLDRLSRTSTTHAGWDANNQTAWSAGLAVTAGFIRRPTVANARTYRAQNSGTTHATTEPTWPTTAGGTVTDNGITWKETTATGSIFATKYANPLRANSETAWQASHAYALGDVVRPTVASGRSYVATNAATSGGSQPTWPTTAGGTVVDGSVTWKETTNYPAASTIEFDLNQEVECAAALALLLTDSLSDFFPAGAYRTAANTYITGVCELLRAYQASGGKVPIGDPIPPADGRPMYDTLYGGYSAQTAGLVYRLMGAVNAELPLFINRAATWLITDYSTEPYAGVHYAGGVSVESNEIANRLAGSTLAGLTDPLDKLLFTTAFFNTTSGKQTLYAVTGNGTARSDALQARYLDGRAVQAAAIGAVPLLPTGIASISAVGTPAITLPTQTISPSGIASGEAVGSPALTWPSAAPTPRTLAEIIAASHTVAVLVEVLENGEVVDELDTVIDGTVTLDQTAATRGRCDIALVDDGSLGLVPNDAGDLLAPYGNELRISRGVIHTDGTTEYVRLGVFRIETPTVDDTGDQLAIRIAGLDRSARIIDARFEEPYQVVAGTNYTTAIEDVIAAAYPDVVTDLTATSRTTPQLIAQEGDDRWAFAQDMARAIGMTLYFDGDGTLVLRPVSAAGQTPVAVLAEGEDGLLVQASRAWTRQGSFNRVIATGENTGLAAPVRGVATDDNPLSPTYYYGPFGKVPRFYSSPFLTTDDQCDDAAQAILARELGTTESVDFGSIVNPALKPDDVVTITRARAGIAAEDHVLDSVTIPLTAEGGMTGKTRATQVNAGTVGS